MQNTSHVNDHMPSIAVSTLVEDLTPEAKTLLERNGCNIIPAGGNKTIVAFPYDTTRQRLLTNTPERRNRIRFSNGLELREVVEGEGENEHRTLYVNGAVLLKEENTEAGNQQT